MDVSLETKAKIAVPKKSSHKWTPYKATWKILEENGFEPTEAAEWIIKEAGLPKEETPKLRSQIESWRHLERKKKKSA